MVENYNYPNVSGRSAGWLAHQHGGLGVGGSSPLAPIYKFFIVIPVYNEERTLPNLIDFISRLGFLKNVIFIDDGSQDSTREILEGAGVLYLRNKKNAGKGFSQRRGFEEALKRGAEIIITMDGDFQHDPSFVPIFLKKIEEGYDIIIGTRWADLRKMPQDRFLSNRLTTLAISLLTCRKVEDSQSGFRAYRREVLEMITFESNKFEAESEILIRALLKGKKIGYVPIPALYHEKLKSKINRVTDTIRFLKMYFEILWKKS